VRVALGLTTWRQNFCVEFNETLCAGLRSLICFHGRTLQNIYAIHTEYYASFNTTNHRVPRDLTFKSQYFAHIIYLCASYKGKSEKKSKLFPVHVMKAYWDGRGIVLLILNLSVKWRWVVNMLRPFYPRRKLRYTLKMRLGEVESRSGRFGEEKYLFPLPGFQVRVFQPVAFWLYPLNHPGCFTCFV
jgi:hypothetical protein